MLVTSRASWPTRRPAAPRSRAANPSLTRSFARPAATGGETGSPRRAPSRDDRPAVAWQPRSRPSLAPSPHPAVIPVHPGGSLAGNDSHDAWSTRAAWGEGGAGAGASFAPAPACVCGPRPGSPESSSPSRCFLVSSIASNLRDGGPALPRADSPRTRRGSSASSPPGTGQEMDWPTQGHPCSPGALDGGGARPRSRPNAFARPATR